MFLSPCAIEGKNFIQSLLSEAVDKELLTKLEYDEYLNIPFIYDLLGLDERISIEPIDYILICLGYNRRNVENDKFYRYVKAIKTLMPNYKFNIDWFIRKVYPVMFKQNINCILEYIGNKDDLHYRICDQNRVDLLFILYTTYPDHEFCFKEFIHESWDIELNPPA